VLGLLVIFVLFKRVGKFIKQTDFFAVLKKTSGGIAVGATGALMQRQIRRIEEGTDSVLCDTEHLLLRSGQCDSFRDVGGIILVLAPAYSLFPAAYFRAPCYSCDFSQESAVETQPSVRSFIFSPTKKHHRYTSHLSLSFERHN
ncbi:hypothetical protein XENOCAPTIV_012539, partial [Xenoophorus captivus]